jgi:NAD-dependent SIR2 family protein deacetylase
MTDKMYCKNCNHEVKYHDDKIPRKPRFGSCEECSECQKERALYLEMVEKEKNKNQGWNGAI